MQFECKDYYEECGFNEGCCLKCSKAHPECLCSECKCRKCYWYKQIDSDKGICEKKLELAKERRINFRKNIIKKQKIDNLLFEKKKEFYKNKAKIYSCQNCQFIFDGNEKENKIIIGKTPVCKFCSGEKYLSREELFKIDEEVREEINKLNNEGVFNDS